MKESDIRAKDDAHKFQARLPLDLWEIVRVLAEEGGRSLHGQILFMLRVAAKMLMTGK